MSKPDTGPLKGFISVTEAAVRLGVAERTIRNWIFAGYIKATQKQPADPRSPYRIPETEITRIIALRDESLKD